jgi:hypothetical protein
MNTLARLALLVLLAPFASPAAAQGIAEGIEVGSGLICNASAEVERFLTFRADGGEVADAIARINADAGPNACGVATIAFSRGEQAGKKQVKEGEVAIVKIVVVGVYANSHWNAVAPTVQFTAFLTKQEEA